MIAAAFFAMCLAIVAGMEDYPFISFVAVVAALALFAAGQGLL